MKELFVPYELAVKLQEKGFDDDCICSFTISGRLVSKVYTTLGKDCNCIWTKDDFDDLRAPLYQQVVEWLDKKGIFIEITPEFYTDGINWSFQVWEYDPNGYECTSDRSSMMMMYGDNHEYPERIDAIKGAIEEALKLI